MSRTLILGALATVAAFGATSAIAQPAGAGYYTATPIEAPSANKTSLITRDTVWKFRDGTFNANQAPEREMVLCQLVAQRVGKLQSFTVGGRALDAAALDQCNAKAK